MISPQCCAVEGWFWASGLSGTRETRGLCWFTTRSDAVQIDNQNWAIWYFEIYTRSINPLCICTGWLVLLSTSRRPEFLSKHRQPFRSVRLKVLYESATLLVHSREYTACSAFQPFKLFPTNQIFCILVIYGWPFCIKRTNKVTCSCMLIILLWPSVAKAKTLSLLFTATCWPVHQYRPKGKGGFIIKKLKSSYRHCLL